MKCSSLPFCPYCGKKLKYSESFFIHKNGEYTCNKCGYNSKILYTKKLRIYAVLAIIISLVVTSMFIFFGKIYFFEVIVVLLPFIFFYIKVPSTMFLSKTEQINYLNRDSNFIDTNILPNIDVKLKRNISNDYSDNMQNTKRIGK